MKNNRYKTVQCFTITGAVTPPKANHTHNVQLEMCHEPNVGIKVTASHFQADEKAGLRCRTFGIGGMCKSTKQKLSIRPRFSQKHFDAIEETLLNDQACIEKLVSAELWNQFKVYPPQLDIDHEAGTVEILELNDAVVIDPCKPVDEVMPANGTDWTLEELYKLLNCDMIEVVRVTDDLILIIDEEGKLKHSTSHNREATEVMNYHHNPTWSDVIVGKAVLCPSSMLK